MAETVMRVEQASTLCMKGRILIGLSRLAPLQKGLE
jgi:hypothetical protein